MGIFEMGWEKPSPIQVPFSGPVVLKFKREHASLIRVLARRRKASPLPCLAEIFWPVPKTERAKVEPTSFLSWKESI